MLTEEKEKREKVVKDLSELKMTFEKDKLEIVTETKVLRNFYGEEAKLRRDLVKDSLEKKLKIEELKMKIQLLETENKRLKAQQAFTEESLGLRFSPLNYSVS